MRQGQQNRRGRGRSNNNNNNNSSNNNSNSNSPNNRKPQNPLSRNFESSGPDVKIRGTAAQIAEKYMLLARDASSASDTVMAENYLQHAEHYNRIIMAAQAQAQATTMSHHGPENGHTVNGSQRYPGEMNGAMRDQPQPHLHAHSAPQPHIQPPMAPQAQPQPQVQSNTLDEIPEFLQSPVREPRRAPEPREDAAAPSGEGDPVRRRRKRYTAANGASRGTPAADGSGGAGKQIEVSSAEERPSDEALI
jgi:Domain of unknown function (DUF4167)